MSRAAWRWVHRAAALVALLAASDAAARGQGLRFDFELSNPGARSLGLGGAFAALADDATAAYANPAGLVQLTRTELSLEGRHWQRSPSFIAGGRSDGEPTGRGIDTDRGVRFGRDQSHETAPSFASVVHPRGRWTFALYTHQAASFSMRGQSQGLFTTEGELIDEVRSPGVRERADLTLETVGAAAAYRFDERFSVGLAVVHAEARLLAGVDAYLPDDDSEASRFGPLSFLPERRIARSDLVIDGDDLTLSAGLLWSVNQRLSTGLFYRRGARIAGRAGFEFQLPDFPVFSTEFPATFAAPDVLGAGAAFRSTDGRVTLAAELDRVGYRGLVQVRTEEGLEDFVREYRDTWEYRLGGEYALLSRRPVIALRAGAWLESPSNDLVEERVVHFAAGVGIAGERVQLDLGVDLSTVVDTAAASLIYSF
jgi:long-chain fatty acid transport protein